MIRLVEALNYRCLRYIKQQLGDFHVLVGPNASGKTTFLDVLSFLGDLFSNGLESAIQKRTSNFEDLLFAQKGNRLELAVEMEIPQDREEKLVGKKFNAVRYEVAIGSENKESEIQILSENVILLNSITVSGSERNIFPESSDPPQSIMNREGTYDKKTVLANNRGNFIFNIETIPEAKGSDSTFLGSQKFGLGHIYFNELVFPVTAWMLNILREGIQQIMLNSLVLRMSSPPGQGVKFTTAGSNLPWTIYNLQKDYPEFHNQWIRHIRTALPDLKSIETIEIPDTRHRYLKLVYENGISVPSWMTSDGTLRLLALTLPAYLPEFKGVYLIEEPENGIHPLAMETVFQALQSVKSAQILLATHSPVILGCANIADILCFKKASNGAADIVNGLDHPALKQWQGSLNLADLYASGVLG